MRRHHGVQAKYRRPFWLPASSYYILASAATIAVFFLVWGSLHEGIDDTAYVPAGLSASIVLGSAVFLREILLRKARNRFLRSRQLLDRSIQQVPMRPAAGHGPPKLTLERNAAILREIARKSEAAKVLGRLAESHREVCELCEEYMAVAARELPNVGVGSPRIGALRRGNEIASEYHRYHLLQWAEIQSRTLTQDAQRHVKLNDKLGAAQQALSVIDHALKFYPDEADLRDSEAVLNQIINSMKATGFIEKAERAKFKGKNKLATGHYKDALFHLARNGSDEADAAVEKIKKEIESLKGLPDKT